jgi:hypothetical protein
MPLPTVALTVEKMFPANCIPSPESPEKRTTTWSSSFTSKFSAIIINMNTYFQNSRAKVLQIMKNAKQITIKMQK